jgi:hypothetical protein
VLASKPKKKGERMINLYDPEIGMAMKLGK